ncbi:hypothetical protein ACH4NR_37870 [Streptomyces globisporus]|uniref:hypothetical protein n=1 Tax=Streptomyces globisporus TaxID=1908 RepID=UPI00378C537A
MTIPVTPAVGADSVELPALSASVAPGAERVAVSARSAEAELRTVRAPLTKGVDRLGGRLRPAGASEVQGGPEALCADVTQGLYGALHTLVPAVLTDLEYVESTRTDAVDRIRAHGRKTDEALHCVGGQVRR